jgi:tryptophanyl-tRNA synthetase
VGDDQRQHIEFARDLAISVNYTFSQKLFSVPEGLYGFLGFLQRSFSPYLFFEDPSQGLET